MILKKIISEWLPSTCISCGRKAKEPPLCTICKKITPCLSQQLLPSIALADKTLSFFTLFEYQKIRNVLHAVKYKDSMHCLNIFSDVLSRSFVNLPIQGSPCIAPLPMSPTSQRGFNQAEELIRPFAMENRYRIENIFTRIPESRRQKSLSSRQRFKNISSTLFLNHVPNEDSIILFDDTITTGATMRAAYTLLKPYKKNIILASLCFNR